MALWPEAFLQPLPADLCKDLQGLREHICGSFIAAIKSEFHFGPASVLAVLARLKKLDVDLRASHLIQFLIFFA